jgi:required for meiotic nuclear division protein 1
LSAASDEQRKAREVMTSKLHRFHAVAFVENFNLKELALAFAPSRVTAHALRFEPPGAGAVFLFAFGVVVFEDASEEVERQELERLRRARPGLSAGVVSEEFAVLEDAGSPSRIVEGVLHVHALTPPRAGVVALIVAQSAAMEYYERIVDRLSERTRGFVEKLEARGTASFRMRPLHRFIGEAIGARGEVLAVLHLLDKPDETWEDPVVDRIYDDLRAEFDLGDRYEATESKLRSVQEALELVLGVARDRRLVLLEAAIVLLIVLEIVLKIA